MAFVSWAMYGYVLSSPHSPADFPHCQVSPTGQPLERRIANRWMPSTGIWHSAGASRCFKNCRNPKRFLTETDRLFRPSPHVLPHLSRFQSKLHCILIIQVLSRSKIPNSWKLVLQNGQNGLKRFKLKISKAFWQASWHILTHLDTSWYSLDNLLVLSSSPSNSSHSLGRSWRLGYFIGLAQHIVACQQCGTNTENTAGFSFASLKCWDSMSSKCLSSMTSMSFLLTCKRARWQSDVQIATKLRTKCSCWKTGLCQSQKTCQKVQFRSFDTPQFRTTKLVFTCHNFILGTFCI